MGAPEAFTATADVGHYIAGARHAGHQRPPPGRSTTRPPAPWRARCVLGSEADVDAAVAAAKAAFPAWADTPPIRRARVLQKFLRAAEPAPRHAGRDDHRRARQGLHRRAGRGHARHRHRRVRLRRAAAAEGRLHRPGVAPASTTGRCASRWAWWPASRRSTSRAWCRAGCSRWRWPAATPSSSSPASATRRRALFMAELLKQAGLPDGVFNVVQGDKVAVDALLDASRRQGAELRRLDADRALHLRDRRAPRQARAGAGRREEPHGGDARCRPRAGGRRADRRAYGSAGERCMAISVAVLVGDVADKIVPKLAERAKALKIKNGMELDAEMGPIVTRAGEGAHRGLHRARRRRKAPSWWSTAAAARCRATTAASSPAARCSTT